MHHAGDVDFSDHSIFDTIGKRFSIDAALLPIGGMMPVWYYRFRRRALDRGIHIDPDCALDIFERLGARSLVPIHWGTVHLRLGLPSMPRRRLAKISTARNAAGVRILDHGERLEPRWRGRVRAMTDLRRAATILGWHVVVTATALTAGAVFALATPEVRRDLAHGSYTYVQPLYLAVLAPAWAIAALQLVQLGRATDIATRAWRAAALGLGLAAAACICAELCSRAELRSETVSPVTWSALAAITAVAGLVIWMGAASRAGAQLAARIAANTMSLPTVRRREQALQLAVLFRLIVPVCFASTITVGLAAPSAAIAIVMCGVLAFLGAALALASILARCRELPAAIGSNLGAAAR